MPLSTPNTNSPNPGHDEGLEAQVGNVCYSIVERTKHAKRGRSGWSGPGVFVTVVRWVDDGTGKGNPVHHPLSDSNRRRFGWLTWWCGEGYWDRRGPRSATGKAYQYARELVEREVNLLNSRGEEESRKAVA